MNQAVHGFPFLPVQAIPHHLPDLFCSEKPRDVERLPDVLTRYAHVFEALVHRQRILPKLLRPFVLHR